MKLSPAELKEALKICENEPIRIPGMVQPHGMLIVLRQSDFTILQISESVFDLIGVHPSELLHQPLSSLMDRGPVEVASRRLGERTPRLLNPIPIRITANGVTHEFDGILHRSGRTIILELERHVAEARFDGGFGGFYESIRETISKIMQAENLEQVFNFVCEDVREFTGFSRVLIYKFDEQWNGEVIAEAKDEHTPTLMHHRFPASDIPKQARELYTVNWLRLIPNVNYTPAKMVPVENPLTGKPLDMSNAVLRSVSPVHLEYMRNMGQLASMSISLMKGQKLWGLIACHNPEPLYLRYDVRVAAEFVGQMTSTQIVAREEASENDFRLQLKAIYDDLLKRGGTFTQVHEVLSANASNLMALTDSPAVALVFDGQITTYGNSVSTEEITKISEWLERRGQPIFSSNGFKSEFPEASAFQTKASGVLAIRIPHTKPAMIIWLRPEVSEQIIWAGNPELSKQISPDGRIHPRSSFATWLEQTSGTSRKWSESEIAAADQLRGALAGLGVRDGVGQISEDEEGTFRLSLAQALSSNVKSSPTSQAEVVDENDHDLDRVLRSGKLLLEGFSDVALLILNRDGSVKNWSAGAAKLIGLDEASDLANFNQLLSDEEVLGGKSERVFDQALRYGRTEEETWIFRRDRSSFWGKIAVSRILNDAANTIGFTVVLRDITEERASEEELRATKLAAEAANVAKTSFIANISHEIRTPLGAILGFSEIMAQKGQSTEQRENLYMRIKRNGDQLIALINDLLDVTKIEAGRLEIEKIPFDLQALLTDIKETFSIKAAEKSIRFEIKIVGELPKSLICDPTRIRQILVNLLSNAIKFTDNGGSVVLECSLDRSLQGHDRLSFRVCDTGRGMTETEMAKLFQPFVQADVSTTRKYGGTGLGLFVSQRLARALGGDLNIERSTPKKGTVFLVQISVEVPAGAARFTTFGGFVRNAPTPESAKYVERFKNKRILVVDDAADNRALVEHFLRKTGIDVEMAENGLDALGKIEEGRFDVVLMDIQMPIMDGNVAMRNLKAKSFATPVIALTANAMQGERELAIGIGFSDYLTKPINRGELLESLGRWLRREHD